MTTFHKTLNYDIYKEINLCFISNCTDMVQGKHDT